MKTESVHIYDRGELLQMYLDWFNNFLTIGRFAEYYGISEEFAEQVVIPVGRDTLNGQLHEGKFVEVRTIKE